MLSLVSQLLLLATLSAIATASPVRRDTGCDMTPGSPLMVCLGSYASIPPVPSATASAGMAGSLADATQLTRIANCWARGLYCSEWQPLMIAADKVCFLASSASSASQPVETSVFSSVTAEASRVVTSIWNNDVGTAIPSISQDLVPSTSYPSGTHISASAMSGATGGMQTAAADRSNAAERVAGRSWDGWAALVAAASVVAITTLLAA
ncbi:hypothetical protein NBRC10512_006422 [Rhodotorula toruloides]|uniref:Uncharacterized protein n=1 Tax=Rhodotorula toruloides (strain NP11) TaxID=1130832 RepID=M7WPN5_RHOT1|nr:uncharacterized protein RHTO_04107 [Rhodotorula toruloides NP11]EMS19815.1 hypothetical protein RHTO_04107 [Rhodotorula toruloides NP11]